MIFNIAFTIAYIVNHYWEGLWDPWVYILLTGAFSGIWLLKATFDKVIYSVIILFIGADYVLLYTPLMEIGCYDCLDIMLGSFFGFAYGTKYFCKRLV